MKIQIEPHTLQRAEERGTNIEEIQIVLEQEQTFPREEIGKQKQRCFPSKKNDLANITKKSGLK